MCYNARLYARAAVMRQQGVAPKEVAERLGVPYTKSFELGYTVLMQYATRCSSAVLAQIREGKYNPKDRRDTHGDTFKELLDD